MAVDKTLMDLISDPFDDLASALHGAQARESEPVDFGRIDLPLDQLVPDMENKVVFTSDVDVNILLGEGHELVAAGSAPEGMSVLGEDVSAYFFYEFDDGLTVYSDRELTFS